jgi:prevent-host-death family protein
MIAKMNTARRKRTAGVARITAHDLRFRFERVLTAVKNGATVTLTYRNRPMAKIVPLQTRARRIRAGDPIYRFHEFAEPMGTLINRQLDRILYGRA